MRRTQRSVEGNKGEERGRQERRREKDIENETRTKKMGEGPTGEEKDREEERRTKRREGGERL